MVISPEGVYLTKVGPAWAKVRNRNDWQRLNGFMELDQALGELHKAALEKADELMPSLDLTESRETTEEAMIRAAANAGFSFRIRPGGDITLERDEKLLAFQKEDV